MKLVLKYFGKVIKEGLLEEGREYIIGRQETCDFVLQEETGLSRKHIKIYQSEETGNWIVESVSEWGGLYLEGEEVAAVELEQSCSLVLKNHVLDFVAPVAPPAESQREKLKEELTEVGEKPEPSPDTGTMDRFSEGTRLLTDSGLIYSLYVYIDGEFSDHVRLNEGPIWIIGRAEECDISIDYSILTRKHLQISKTNGKFYIKDMGSSNKTFLNDRELEPHKEEPLRANDEISVADLKMVFEVRDKDYDKKMNQLPVPDEPSSNEIENLPEIAMPKVVLEDAPEEEVARGGASLKKAFLNKKRIVLVALLIALGAGLYFQQESKKKKKALAEMQKKRDQKNKLEVFYSQALVNLEKQQYQLCINQLEELHQKSATGHLRDSQQILIQCQNALENQRQQEEYLSQEEAKKETEGKIKKIVDKCEREYKENKIQTEGDLNQCAGELLGGLDPTNAVIAAIRMEINEKASLKLLEDQKKEMYRAKIRSKRALYNKALKIRDQNKPLKAVSAYNVFLKSARGTSSLKKLYQQAIAERDEIQKKYDDELASLHKSCESLIQNRKMKEAYYDCKKVLGFKADDKKAKQYIQQALADLRKKLKPLYEQSMLDESFSRIEEAKKLWSEILEKDVKGGYYYKKASAQIQKYK